MIFWQDFEVHIFFTVICGRLKALQEQFDVYFPDDNDTRSGN